MAGSTDDAQVSFNRRTMVLGLAGATVWTGLVGRFAQLQLIGAEQYRTASEENRIRHDLAPPLRGQILDRFARPLAVHRQAGHVSVLYEQVNDLDATLDQIAAYIELSPARRQRIVREARAQPGFVPTVVARELTYEEFARITLHAAEMPGVLVEMGTTRSYPRGREFAHVLGYVAKASQMDMTRLILERVRPGLDPDQAKELAANPLDGSIHPLRLERALREGSDLREKWHDARIYVSRLYRHPDMRTGRSGIEYTCDDYLSGRAGWRAVEVSANGRIMGEVPARHKPAVPGKDLVVTIDAGLQRKAIERFGEESGAAVVLDVTNGDILALVSTPAFDPNAFVNGISQAAYDTLRNNERSPLYHKAFDGIYPPGSTFKMVVATAALEAGVIDPSERVYCNGRYPFGNRTWHCWRRRGHGAMNMHEGLKQSCDVYFYEIAKRTGVEKIAETARRFGFGQAWTLGLTGGARGVVPDDAWKRSKYNEPWVEGETLNFGIGQGFLSATPLQLALMSARVARGGGVLDPRLVVAGPTFETTGRHDATLDTQAMERMRAGMFGVTSEPGGTARRAGDLGLGGPRMAGKTGTAQVRRITEAERASGVRSNEDVARRLRDHALFVGYAPADAPEYAISVVVEHGGGGSRAAAPVARDIMAEALRRQSARAPAVARDLASRASGGGEGSP